MQFRLSRWKPNTTRAGNSIAMSSSISLSVLPKSIRPTLCCFLLLFRTLLFLKASLAMWCPEPNAFWHVHSYHTGCLLWAQLGDMSINAEAAQDCTGLVCCFHLLGYSRQLNCSSDFLGLFWQRGNTFKPNIRAALLAFGWVQKLLARFLQGHLTCFFVLLKSYASFPTFNLPHISIVHLVCNITVHLKIQEANPRLSSLSLPEWVYNNWSSGHLYARYISEFPSVSTNSFHPSSLP